MTKPNILILMVDQMSGTLLDDDMISHLHIPNMRKLIDRGVKFQNAYSSSPLCTPARASFMTGQLPSRNGVYDNAAEFTASTPTFAHYLRDLGYQTSLCGKMHFVGPDQLHGFEERLTTDIYPADFGWTPNWDRPQERIHWWYHNLSSVTDAGVAEISNQLEFDDEVAHHAKLKLHQLARRHDRRPFCLCVSFTHPHDPYIARQKYWDLYNHSTIPMPKVASIEYAQQDPHSQRLLNAVDHANYNVTDADVRNARHAYFSNVSYLDEKIGELVDVLQRCDFADNTDILLCADHGDMLGERGLWYKMTFLENSSRVPMVLATAGYSGSARTVSTPVTTHDILPTLLELAGGRNDRLVCEIDGRSVIELFSDGEDPERIAIAEYCAEGSVAPLIMIRRGAYKFIYCPADPPQLFDLGSDPLEKKNLARDESHSSTVKEFMTEIADHCDIERFASEVSQSQRRRRLINSANRKGQLTPWDYQPRQDSSQRYMRNHMDLNAVESGNRYPKPDAE